MGAFWGQTTRLRLPEIATPVLSTPMALHMAGEMDGIVYAQLLAGPRLKQVRRRADLSIAWSRQRAGGGREISGVNSFASRTWDSTGRERLVRKKCGNWARNLPACWRRNFPIR